MDVATKLFIDKLQDALKSAGIHAQQMNIRGINSNQFHIEAILINKSNGGMQVEEAKLVEEDYRIKAIEETKSRLGRNF